MPMQSPSSGVLRRRMPRRPRRLVGFGLDRLGRPQPNRPVRFAIKLLLRPAVGRGADRTAMVSLGAYFTLAPLDPVSRAEPPVGADGWARRSRLSPAPPCEDSRARFVKRTRPHGALVPGRASGAPPTASSPTSYNMMRP